MKPLSSRSSLGSCTSSRSQLSPCVRMKGYSKIKLGLRRANPAAIILWAFHKLPSSGGLTSRRVIDFLKRYYVAAADPRRSGKSFGVMLRSAVEFGLLERKGNRYYLAKRRRL